MANETKPAPAAGGAAAQMLDADPLPSGKEALGFSQAELANAAAAEREEADAMQDTIQAPPPAAWRYVDPPLNLAMPQLTPVEASEFKTVAFELGLGQGQYQQARAALQIAAHDAERIPLAAYSKQTEVRLQKLWGDQTETMLGYARSVAREIMDKNPAAAHLFRETHAGSNEALVRLMAEIGQRRARR